MVQNATTLTPLQILTFDQYLHHQAGTDTRYELVRGLLLPMTPAPWPHSKIAKFLERIFDDEITQQGLPWEAVRGDVGQRTEANTARLPDVLVAQQADLDALGNRSAVLEVPALVVVEIVSESSKLDDYLYKLAEYRAQQIPEYWVVDYLGLGAARYIGAAQVPTVSIYSLVGATYQVQQFQGLDGIVSPTFPALVLTAEQVFKGRQDL
ncbi:MAG: Uma2 family endonuclease [Leptolyngbya sp. RL_3_1]|nr:Uma2 family endonuclease [Leptolyngbya sp. RL_3_1]